MQNKDEKIKLLNNFYDTTSTLILYWKDTFDEFNFLFIDDSQLIKKYKFLGKTLVGVSKIASHIKTEEFFSPLIQDDIEHLQTIFIVYKSDEILINSIFDSELYELDLIYNEFYKILLNMRETNIIKTTYLFNRLLKTSKNTLDAFLIRYPQIKNKFLKIDPEQGYEFLEF